ncbi:probable E3 ubiquitin-protein ligase RNF217 isoform X2 [Amblyraja radiata]|uniref:probable E3 ubiquitin-protein ligase RNF217 isoform X2 n=1 Tax=Amblyraja radiata TaxID=386614 RepID=UPI001403976A|nr:probable E3 ubiquitin-protein ligase RNF217 isoform X2 [Amblyraja radiata]
MGLESGMEDESARDGGDMLTSSEDEDAAENVRATELPPRGVESPDVAAGRQHREEHSTRLAPEHGSCSPPANLHSNEQRPAGLQLCPVPADLHSNERRPPGLQPCNPPADLHGNERRPSGLQPCNPPADLHGNERRPSGLEPCPADLHCNERRPSGLEPCPADLHCNERRPSELEPCPADLHCNEHRPAGLEPCPADLHCNERRPSGLEPCPADLYCNERRPSELEPCPADLHCNEHRPAGLEPCNPPADLHSNEQRPAGLEPCNPPADLHNNEQHPPRLQPCPAAADEHNTEQRPSRLAHGLQPCPPSADQQQRPAGLEPCPEHESQENNEDCARVAAQQGRPWPGSELSQHVYCTVYCVENENHQSSALKDEGEQTNYPSESGRSTPTALGRQTPTTLRLSITEPFNISQQIDINSLGNLYVGEYTQLIILTCRVCLDDKPIRPLPCCKKAVCEECLKRYLSNQVQLGRAEIKCPITECSEYMDESTVISNLPRDDIVKYSYFLELSRMDSSTKPCPQCKHFTTWRLKSNIPNPTKSENKFKIQCPVCQFVWCFKCHSPWHQGLNCKEYRKGDKLLRHWASEIEHGQRNAQKCPKCKIHIQRTEGCDHMNCSQCNTNFCYRCGETYRQLRFFGDHTSNLSIFGCKYRYLPDRPHLRRLVRGSVCGLFIFPIYYICKKQRKRSQTGMFT